MLKSKTFWTAVAGAATAVGAYFGGELDLTATIASVFAAASVIFLRDGVRKAIPAAALLFTFALTGCATSGQPQDAKLGESGHKDVVAAGFHAVATTKNTARLYDVDPARTGGDVYEPMVLWNPELKEWTPILDAEGKPVMKRVTGVQNYNNYIGSHLSVTATGTGSTEGTQSQQNEATNTPTTTTDTNVSGLPK